MAIGLIGWGRFLDGAGNRITVPAPSTDAGAPWLVDFLRSEAAALGASFDLVQWPPTSKAQGGAGSGCDGYGLFDRRDLGSKNQRGSVPTRYGPLEGLLAAVAALNAHGVRSFGDLVLHQMSGENGGAGVFRYLGADGKTQNGRGATTPGWFRGQTSPKLDAVGNQIGWNDPVPPFCAEDDVPSREYDYAFGRELSYQHCSPAWATYADALDWIVWLSRRVGFAGYRYDDVKGSWPEAVGQLMKWSAVQCAQFDAPVPQFTAEYFDGDPNNLNAWATSAAIGEAAAVEDFTLHWRIQAACNGFDARQLEAGGAGYFAMRPDLAVAFVDNPDTDTSPGQQVVFNKGLAYAYMLMLPCRMALVYGKDYFPASVWPGAYGLRPLIDNLCWISRMFAIGAYQVRWVDKDVHVSTRDGNGGPLGWSGGLLTGINFNVLAPRTVTVETPFGPNKWLHDYTGHHPDIWTDAQGWATFTIPSNAYSGGQSYVCFAPGGVNKPVTVQRAQTTQTFIADAAGTLDVRPLRNGLQELPQRIRCAAGSAITVTLQMDRTGVAKDASVQLEILYDAAVNLAWATTGLTSTATARVPKVPADGWYAVRLIGNLLPAEGAGFEVSVTYTGAGN